MIYKVVGYIKPVGELARLMAGLHGFECDELYKTIKQLAKDNQCCVYEHITCPGLVELKLGAKTVSSVQLHLHGYTIVAEVDDSYKDTEFKLNTRDITHSDGTVESIISGVSISH